MKSYPVLHEDIEKIADQLLSMKPDPIKSPSAIPGNAIPGSGQYRFWQGIKAGTNIKMIFIHLYGVREMSRACGILL